MMKKFLISTTLISMTYASAALAGGSLDPYIATNPEPNGGAHDAAPAAAPVNTGGLTVMIGGKFNFQSVFQSQDENALLGNGARGEFFRNDTQLNFTAAGSTENFDYGAVIEIEADSGPDKNAINSPANTSPIGGGAGRLAYLYVENDTAGRFEGGSNVGASDTLEVDAAKVARATGGVDGDWKYNILTGGNTYITDPDLPTANDDTVAGRSNKITYYSPRFSGAQIGVSYSPDTGNRGTAAAISSDANSDFENVFAGGINYEADLEGVGLMASAVGEWGEREPSAVGAPVTLNDLTAFSLGLGLEMNGFSVAGNWADLGESLAAASGAGNNDSRYWSAGAGYENGPYGVSVTYLNSEQGTGLLSAPTANTGTNQLSNLVVGADYQMAPGMTPFVEASFFDLDAGSTTAAYDNNGNVVLVGAEVAF